MKVRPSRIDWIPAQIMRSFSFITTLIKIGSGSETRKLQSLMMNENLYRHDCCQTPFSQILSYIHRICSDTGINFHKRMDEKGIDELSLFYIGSISQMDRTNRIDFKIIIFSILFYINKKLHTAIFMCRTIRIFKPC